MSELDNARRTLGGLVSKVRLLQSRIERLEAAIAPLAPIDNGPRPSYPALMDTAQAASYLGMSKSTLEQSRSYKTGGPDYVKMGRSVRYRREDLDSYMLESSRSALPV